MNNIIEVVVGLKDLDWSVNIHIVNRTCETLAYMIKGPVFADIWHDLACYVYSQAGVERLDNCISLV